MTKNGKFKKVVRRHAAETGQRYTKALTDLEGLQSRMHHEPVGDRLVRHFHDHYGIDATGARRISVHKTYVFRIDRGDGQPWVARAFPPARPRAAVEGDAGILRFLQSQDFPAERPAADHAVSDFEGSAVLVTRFEQSRPLPDGPAKFVIMADLLGRLHSLPLDESITRPGGASGEDPSRAGAPSQDLGAALAFLDSVATLVGTEHRDRFEALRETIRTADAGDGLPIALLHGNLPQVPDHAVIGPGGPVMINWKASGVGPRLADLAYLLWVTWADETLIKTVADSYGRHVQLTDDELDRLEAVLAIRPLYLMGFDFRRGIRTHRGGTVEWYDPDYLHRLAELARPHLRNPR